MRTALALTLIAAAVSVGVPAHAASTIVGTTCGLVVVQNDVTSGQNYQGVLVAGAATIDGRLPSITCTVYVDGNFANQVSSTGVAATVAVALGLAPTEASDSAVVTVCTLITYGSTTHFSGCTDASRAIVPPQEVCDIAPVCVGVLPQRVLYVLPEPVLV